MALLRLWGWPSREAVAKRRANELARWAVLIDADHTHPDAAGRAIVLARARARVTVSKAYRNWTDGHKRSWNSCLLKYGIDPIQVAPGKNATDLILTIDAMDLLHGRCIDGLFIVSRDRDFVSLAKRAREAGLVVCCAAEAPESLRAVCDESLALMPIEQSSPMLQPPKARLDYKRLRDEILTAYEKVKHDCEGWALLSDVGENVVKWPGRGKLGAAIRRVADYFEYDLRPFDGKGEPVACIRRRNTPA